MRGLFAHTNAATERVLARTGHTVTPSGGQACCGALHAHAGDLESARALAKCNIAAFERQPGSLIAVNSAGCGAMLKEYGHLLHDDPAWHDRATAVAARVRDVSELLATSDLVSNDGAMAGPGASPHDAQPHRAAAVRVTYDPPCHLMHAQRITREPLALLRSLPGVELIPLVDSDQCCGSAGIYNLVEPDTSDAVLAPKLQHIAATGAHLVATGNPGCLMQIGAGLLLSGSAARAVHPIELLDATMRD
jgi:glycolate oxidase iron-sulfur subunit